MPGGSKKILLVDDEQDIVVMTKEILEHKGFKVFTALESNTALDLFRKERPSICIIDMHMPSSILDGIGMLREIRKVDSQAYCIMLSRVDDKDGVETAKKEGANRYILKPLTIDELMEFINEAVKVLESRGVSHG